MSVVKRIVDADQTAVVVAEDGCVAVLLFFGDTCAEDFDHPDEVVLLGAGGAEQLAAALIEGAERMRAAA